MRWPPMSDLVSLEPSCQSDPAMVAPLQPSSDIRLFPHDLFEPAWARRPAGAAPCLRPVEAHHGVPEITDDCSRREYANHLRADAVVLARAKALERAGEAQIVSIFGVQPWLDIAGDGLSSWLWSLMEMKQHRAPRDCAGLVILAIPREFESSLTSGRQGYPRGPRHRRGPRGWSFANPPTARLRSPVDSTGVLRSIDRARFRTGGHIPWSIRMPLAKLQAAWSAAVTDRMEVKFAARIPAVKVHSPW